MFWRNLLISLIRLIQGPLSPSRTTLRNEWKRGCAITYYPQHQE